MHGFELMGHILSNAAYSEIDKCTIAEESKGDGGCCSGAHGNWFAVTVYTCRGTGEIKPLNLDPGCSRVKPGAVLLNVTARGCSDASLEQ